MLLDIVCIVAGFILLVKGGDILVDGSVALARRARLSPMVIGLTVMGFGTSAPELLVSAQAALRGSSGIALGNVAGSNMANIGLILGMTAMMRSLPVGRRTLLVDMPFMLGAMGLLVGFAAWTGVIERWMGAVMFMMLVGFVWWEIWRERREVRRAETDKTRKRSGAVETRETIKAKGKTDDMVESGDVLEGVMPLWKALLLVLVSLAAMVWGSDLLVDGASSVALSLGEMLGVGREQMERIVGLTVVAIGTSLPELFASVMAARKGETAMAVGNIIGSVSFNILCVVGVSSMIAPIGDAWAGFAVDYGVMCLLGVVLWVFLRTDYKMVRWEGAVLLSAYALYILSIASR